MCQHNALYNLYTIAGAVSQTLDHKHKLFFLKSSSSIAGALKASWFLFCI